MDRHAQNLHPLPSTGLRAGRDAGCRGGRTLRAVATAMRAGVRYSKGIAHTPGRDHRHAGQPRGGCRLCSADSTGRDLVPCRGSAPHCRDRCGLSPVCREASPNLLPGQLDALLFGITEAAVETVFGSFSANIAGNWFFIRRMTVIFVPIIWFITDRMIEPRLGNTSPAASSMPAPITPHRSHRSSEKA